MAELQESIHNFIDYLTTYNNVGLFDETTQRAARDYSIKPPITLKNDLQDTIVDYLKGKDPVNILVTGVAGDGKTNLCRAVWNSINNSANKEDEWNNSHTAECSITTDDGFERKIFFLKDLTDSAEIFSFENKEHILNRLYDTLNDQENTVVIACNHGQIIKQLQDTKVEHLVEFGKKLERRFFNPNEKLDKGLVLIDLKRSHQDKKFIDIVEYICNRKEWDDCHTKCHRHKSCPILKNRNALIDKEGNASLLSNRIALLFRLLELEGLHFPIRDQLAYIVNILLGKYHTKNDTENLLSCENIIKNESPDVDLYANIFGRNLLREKQLDSIIYNGLMRFDIGNSSTRSLDEIIFYGIPKNDSDENQKNLFISDSFKLISQAYLSADKPLDNLPKLQKGLKRARQEMFFNFEVSDYNFFDGMEEKPSIWELTTFPHAHQYISEFIRNTKKPFKKKKVKPSLIQGLSQIMNGSRKDHSSHLRITTRGTEVSSKSGDLIVASYENSNTFIYIESLSEEYYTPAIIFKTSVSDENPVTFALTPRRYECLMQLSEGFIPSSFSDESLTELLGLKARLIHHYREQNSFNNIDDEFEDADKTVSINLLHAGQIFIQNNEGDSND